MLYNVVSFRMVKNLKGEVKMIPDINLVRERAEELERQEEEEKQRQLQEYILMKDKIADHFYAKIEDAINKSLLEGKKYYNDLLFQDIYTYADESEMHLYLTSEECESIAKEIIERIMNNYTDGGYFCTYHHHSTKGPRYENDSLHYVIEF